MDSGLDFVDAIKKVVPGLVIMWAVAFAADIAVTKYPDIMSPGDGWFWGFFIGVLYGNWVGGRQTPPETPAHVGD